MTASNYDKEASGSAAPTAPANVSSRNSKRSGVGCSGHLAVVRSRASGVGVGVEQRKATCMLQLPVITSCQCDFGGLPFARAANENSHRLADGPVPGRSLLLTAMHPGRNRGVNSQNFQRATELQGNRVYVGALALLCGRCQFAGPLMAVLGYH
ncbi:hypothetical protein BDV95DRAFT_589268 [Massariosphaeria phaeospora]|uniref:Uncharacterized protein n=1 Tax=Massariosphaeria phaeospora TaxID=100035 RepID=A0A7C8MHB7_9PLEO|nr:hypothetical protein BDV95DRAFT_589268 [Massariosphaeria phaeospora]